MLTIFSTQLRKIGKQATNILSTSGEPITPSLALLKIGEYYLKNKKFEQATYAFSKYIEHYPTGEYVEQTKERILLAQKGISTGIQSIAESEPAELSSDDSGHFSLPDEAEVLDDTENNHLNDAGLSDDNEIISSEELFDSATSLIENKQFEQAIEKLTPIIAQENSSEDQVLKTKAAFEISRCYFELEQYKESIGRFTNFIKENPKTDLMKSALFYIGKSQQAFGNIEKAIGFYKKVAGLPPHESINDEAKELLKELS